MKASLIVPVFNEEKSVDYFVEKVSQILCNEVFEYEIIFINDGSTDNTLERLVSLSETSFNIKIVDLSRNFGKEAALSAGLRYCSGNIAIPIDVDMQDPPELIIPMIKKWEDGYDVVLAKRVDRSSDTKLKRSSASIFYKLHNLIAEPKIPENVGDFRLIDRAVVDAINQLPESRRFMKGLFSWMGFKTTTIEYVRQQRSAGSSKFNYWKLWNFAIEGFTSFSIAPLRIWTYVGLVFAIISMGLSLRIVINYLVHGSDTPGYASIFVAITLFGSFQLIGIGILGEYLGRTYIESKRRPVFVINKLWNI